MICPWDVADPARVPAHKTELLLALHALLIGHAHDPEGRVRTLDSDEETLIRDRHRSRLHGSRARPESDRASSCSSTRSPTAPRSRRDSPARNADRLQSLLLRLEPYGAERQRSRTSPTGPPPSRRTRR